jgi:hypothetical protein
MGALSFPAVKTEFENRVDAGELVEVRQQADVPGRAFTTREMITLELRIPAKMNARSGHCERRFRASRSLIGAKRRQTLCLVILLTL